MDNQNLVKEYLNKSQLEGFEGARVKVVKDRGQLTNINIDETDYLLGKFFFIYLLIIQLKYQKFNSLCSQGY